MKADFKLRWLFFWIASVPLFSMSADKEIKMQLFDAKSNKYKTITVVEKNKMTVSTDCLKKSKTLCLASQAVNTKIPLSPSPTGVVGNPAARYCLAHSANSRILLDEKKREFDYCVFKDGSMIDAWSLYNRHHGG